MVSFNDYKILVVDDEPISLRLLTNILDEAHYRYESAENGKEALAKLKKDPEHFAIVIMDRIMPLMSGLELLNIMKKTDILKRIPVIMLTGLSEKEDIIDAVRAGAFDYLMKPVEKDLLIKLCERAFLTFKESIIS